jgi:hypothetical protein
MSTNVHSLSCTAATGLDGHNQIGSKRCMLFISVAGCVHILAEKVPHNNALSLHYHYGSDLLLRPSKKGTGS